MQNATVPLGLPVPHVGSLATAPLPGCAAHSNQACCPGPQGSLSPAQGGRRQTREAGQAGTKNKAGWEGDRSCTGVTRPPQLQVHLPTGLSGGLRPRDTPGLTPPGRGVLSRHRGRAALAVGAPGCVCWPPAGATLPGHIASRLWASVSSLARRKRQQPLPVSTRMGWCVRAEAGP